MPDRPRLSALLTDLYELTMAAAYFENNIRATASFELFVRGLPRNRGYLVAAGLEQALDYLENLRFRSEEVDFLRGQEVFRRVSDAFFESLRAFRLTGETVLLPPLPFQTMIATKAARVVEAAQGRGVVEFGTRRAHGPEAGVLAARAAYIGGSPRT